MTAPVAFAVFSAACFSVGPVLTKELLKQLGPYTCSFCCTALAAGTLFALLAATGRLPVLDAGGRRTALRIAAFFVVIQVVPGLLWFHVLPHVSGIFAMLMKRTQPLFVLFLSVPLLGRRLRPADLGLTALALWGLVMLLGDSLVPRREVFGAWPFLAAVGCVTLWALQFMYARRVCGSFDAVQSAAVGMVAYMVATLPFALLTDLERVAELDRRAVLFLALQGCVVYGLGVAASFEALRHLSAWTVSMVALSGPLFGAAAARLIAGETLSAVQGAGAALVLAAMAGALALEARAARAALAPASPASASPASALPSQAGGASMSPGDARAWEAAGR